MCSQLDDTCVPNITLCDRSSQGGLFVATHATYVALLATYLISFALPAVGDSCGAGVCLLALLDFPESFPWLANPIFLGALITLAIRRFAMARTLGLIAALFAGCFPIFHRCGDNCNIGYLIWFTPMIGVTHAAQLLLLISTFRNRFAVSPRTRSHTRIDWPSQSARETPLSR